MDSNRTTPSIERKGIKEYIRIIIRYIKEHKIQIGSILLIIGYVIASYSIYFIIPDKYNKYTLITNIILTIGGLLLFSYILKKNYSGINYNVKTLLLVLGIIGLASIIIYLVTKSNEFSNVLTLLMNVIIVVGVLSLIYFAIEKIPILKRLKMFLMKAPITKVIYHLIFYIPCILEDIYNYIKETEIGETPGYIYKILLIELIVIVGYLVIPIIKDKVSNYDAKEVLKGPIYLDKKKVHASYEELNGSIEEKERYNYNYGISGWFYIHEQHANMKDTSDKYVSIINYGNKPNVLYNVEQQKLRVLMKTGIDEDEIIYETSNIKLQKWNNIVLNYNSGILDVFINGKLVATSKNKIGYMTLDNITSGEDEGISGGIKEIKYYENPIEKRKIEYLNKN
jgi:hypothetical protein